MASGSVKNIFGSMKNVTETMGVALTNEGVEHGEISAPRQNHGFLQRIGSGIMNMAESITHVDGRTCTYHGLNHVQNETLGIGDTTGGITPAKKMAEWDGLDRASRAATYMMNQGLPGQAWQRGASQADYNILKHLIDDPERLHGGWLCCVPPSSCTCACLAVLFANHCSVYHAFCRQLLRSTVDR